MRGTFKLTASDVTVACQNYVRETQGIPADTPLHVAFSGEMGPDGRVARVWATVDTVDVVEVEIKYTPGDGWWIRVGEDVRPASGWPAGAPPHEMFAAFMDRRGGSVPREWTAIDGRGQLKEPTTFGEVAEVGATYQHTDGWRIDVDDVDPLFVWGHCYEISGGRKVTARMNSVDAGASASDFTKVEG